MKKTKNMTEKEKMLKGLPYDASDKEIRKLFFLCKDKIEKYNKTSYRQPKLREKILRKLFNSVGKNIYIEPFFYCDYGINISVGDNVYLNTNCVFLDCAQIKIGNNVLFGPGVHIYTAYHSTNPKERFINNKIIDIAKSVSIGNNVWIGGNVTILPGVTIVDNVTIGAGSVVTKNISANTIVAGNPAKVLKKVYNSNV